MYSNISGFPEFLPNEQLAFNAVYDIIKNNFESYGFIPLDTAAVEKIDTLLAKGNDSEIYGLCRLVDDNNSKKELGLRFDLTIPLARYVAQHCGEITFPYKRYHMAPVWRGERPQSGRYRQFYQCDIDVVSSEAITVETESEILMILVDTLTKIRAPKFIVKINNRKILFGYLKQFISAENINQAIRIIDKKEKINDVTFDELLLPLLNSKNNLYDIKDFLKLEQKYENFDLINYLNTLDVNEEFKNGVSELSDTLMFLKNVNIDKKFKFSLSLARGLNYYTGMICETILVDFPEIGSISGGGRYDNLTDMLSNKNFPGIGITIGISRLIALMISKNLLDISRSSNADVLVTVQERAFLADYVKIATKIRELGLNVDIYLQNKNLKAQMNYANKKSIRYVAIANKFELESSIINIRDLDTQQQTVIPLDEIHSIKNIIVKL